MISRIKADQRARVKSEEPLAINYIIDTTAGTNRDQSVMELNGEFVHFSLLIDVLIRCKITAHDKSNLINICTEKYADDENELININEFRRQYSSDRAVWWYTRDSFLYRMLNKALRVQNIGLLFLFRGVIGNIYQQLQRHQCNFALTVYRGQIMSRNEREKIQNSIEKFLSINSFFSTSHDRQRALRFLRGYETSDDLERILFVIEANPGVVQSKPFADIDSLSYYPHENEVLFMIGSVFRLESIRQDDEEQVWVIRMVLCNESQYDSQQLLDHIRQQHGVNDGTVDLRQFGDVLHTIGKYKLADDIYKRVLDEPPVNQLSRIYLYRSCGILKRTQAELKSSLDWFHAALDLQMELCPSDYVEISESYNWLGKVYFDQNECKKALEHYSEAFNYLNRASNENNHLKFANVLNNIASVHGRQKRTDEALHYFRRVLDLYKNYLPSKHSTTALCYSNIGFVYFDKEKYDQAMEYFKRALEMRLESLPSQHPDIARSYESIGRTHKKKGELQEALSYYEQAATIYRHSLPSNHHHVIEIEARIEHVSLRLNPFSRFNPIDVFRRSFSFSHQH